MKREKLDSKFKGMLLRYVLLILVAIPNLWIFYTIFTPLTVYPVYLITGIFFNVMIIGKSVLIINNSVSIELIKACIAGAAYYLLLIFNLSVPNIRLKKRLIMIGVSFLALLILNIARIVVLTSIYVAGNPLFNLAHEIFWYALSTVFVLGIWFAEVRIFKVKDIPVYTDIKFLLKKIKIK